MTPEQIDLEFEHMLLDKQAGEGDKKVYTDDDYDRYDEESEDLDRRTSEIPPELENELPKVDINDDDDWEDVD